MTEDAIAVVNAAAARPARRSASHLARPPFSGVSTPRNRTFSLASSNGKSARASTLIVSPSITFTIGQRYSG